MADFNTPTPATSIAPNNRLLIAQGTGPGSEKTATVEQLTLIRITGSTEFFIAPSGNNATGDGSEASPWQTIQGAVDKIRSQYAIMGDVVINAAAGTYPSTLQILRPVAGTGRVIIRGENNADPSLTVMAGLIRAEGLYPPGFRLEDLELSHGNGVAATRNGYIQLSNVRFTGSAAVASASHGGVIEFEEEIFLNMPEIEIIFSAENSGVIRGGPNSDSFYFEQDTEITGSGFNAGDGGRITLGSYGVDLGGNTITGTRYEVYNGGYCTLGAEYPGSADGTIQEGSIVYDVNGYIAPTP